jgi:putative membrane protein
MLKWIITWVISAISLLIVAHIVPGFRVAGFGSALIAAIVIGLINGTLGMLLKFFTWPFRVLSLGLLTWIINAAMLKLATAFVDGFAIDGWFAALLGALLLTVVTTILQWIVPDKKS